MIKNKFIFSFLIGFFFIFNGELKAEEICYYSNVQEYERCFLDSKSSLIKPKYPIFVGNYNRYLLIRVCLDNNIECTSLLRKYGKIQFALQNKDELTINSGKVGLALTFSKFKVSKTINIPSLNILKWSKKTYRGQLGEGNLYSIYYLDEDLNEASLNVHLANNITGINPIKGDIVSEILKTSSNLEQGQKRSEKVITELVNKKISSLEKEYEIITSFIKNSKSENFCIALDKEKFPELVKKSEMISKMIQKLYSRLDKTLPSYIKPICNL